MKRPRAGFTTHIHDTSLLCARKHGSADVDQKTLAIYHPLHWQSFSSRPEADVKTQVRSLVCNKIRVAVFSGDQRHARAKKTVDSILIFSLQPAASDQVL